MNNALTRTLHKLGWEQLRGTDLWRIPGRPVLFTESEVIKEFKLLCREVANERRQSKISR